MPFCFCLYHFSRAHSIQLHISSKELNTQLKEGKPLSEYSDTQAPKPITPGGPGSQWRMMRLRRVYETAEEENRPVEEVAIERFGSLEAFDQAKEERRILDGRGRGRDTTKGKRREDQGYSKAGEKGFIFNDLGGSGGSSRSSSFRRPGGPGESAASTPPPQSGMPSVARARFDSLHLRSQTGTPGQQVRTPIPSVMTPQLAGKRPLSPSSLNRLQAKVLRAKLTDGADAEKLEKEYEEELQRASGINTNEDGVQTRTRVEVLPTLDVRGRLYDVGHGKDDDRLPGNRRKKEKVRLITCSYEIRIGSLMVLARWRLAIQRQERSSGTTPTMTPLHWENCYVRRSSVQELRTKRTWICNSPSRL